MVHDGLSPTPRRCVSSTLTRKRCANQFTDLGSLVIMGRRDIYYGLLALRNCEGFIAVTHHESCYKLAKYHREQHVTGNTVTYTNCPLQIYQTKNKKARGEIWRKTIWQLKGSIRKQEQLIDEGTMLGQRVWEILKQNWQGNGIYRRWLLWFKVWEMPVKVKCEREFLW